MAASRASSPPAPDAHDIEHARERVHWQRSLTQREDAEHRRRRVGNRSHVHALDRFLDRAQLRREQLTANAKDEQLSPAFAARDALAKRRQRSRARCPRTREGRCRTLFGRVVPPLSAIARARTVGATAARGGNAAAPRSAGAGIARTGSCGVFRRRRGMSQRPSTRSTSRPSR